MKGLGGRGKLTDKTIDNGIAIRSNKGNLAAMQKAVMASICHAASSATNKWHDNCPTGSSSWCGYQRDIADNTVTYKPGPGLLLPVFKEVKPVSVDLCKDSWLTKCLDVETQNDNESPNHHTRVLYSFSWVCMTLFPILIWVGGHL